MCDDAGDQDDEILAVSGDDAGDQDDEILAVSEILPPGIVAYPDICRM